jgi:hypothetical protein
MLKIKFLIISFSILLVASSLRAQDSTNFFKRKKNAVLFSGFPTMAKIGYERLIDERSSVGTNFTYYFNSFGNNELLPVSTQFPGFKTELYARIYFLKSSRSGPFFQMKGLTGVLSPYTYSSSTPTSGPGQPYLYDGHKDHLVFYGGGIAIGYRAYIRKVFFIEQLTGVKYCSYYSKYGSDTYMDTQWSHVFAPDWFTETVFHQFSPASIIDFSFSLGMKF